MRSVDEIADELYALPPVAFTAARDAAVTHARSGGDRAGARQLAALKRPTQGAHLVNLLALRRPEVVGQIVELGQQLRSAQGNVSATQLRDLSTRRRTALADALRACRELAAEAGSGAPTAAQLAEAEATLAAAMADDSAAGLVRAGRVVKALSYAGFGAGFGATAPLRATGGRTPAPAGRTQERTVPRDQPSPPPGERDERTAARGHPPPPATETEDEPARQRAAEREAWQRLARAETALAVAQEQENAANEEMDRIADEITRLRGALDTAAKRARTARTARQAAERALNLARREVPIRGEVSIRDGDA